jgi:hypothetical protein
MLQTEIEAHYVYSYRSTAGTGRVRYVGYGETPARALSHRSGSHNPALEAWLRTGNYTLELVGPFRDRAEGMNVESALITSLHPDLNRSPGEGKKFAPLGVPPELADRISMDPLTQSDVARTAGGALFVYLSAGDLMKDGRVKANPTKPDTEVIASDTEGWWQIGRHFEYWEKNPDERPRTLVGCYGPGINSRFIIGSFEIDVEQLATEDSTRRDSGRKWRIPLVDRRNADAASLRGRRLERARFSNLTHTFYHWFDSQGEARWIDGKAPDPNRA